MTRLQTASKRVTRSYIASLKRSPERSSRVLDGKNERKDDQNRRVSKRTKSETSKKVENSFESGNASSVEEVTKRISQVFDGYGQQGIEMDVRKDISTTTQGGWCLLKGLIHVASAHDGILLPVIEKHGIPSFHLTRISNPCRHEKSPYTIKSVEDNYHSFRMLCRIIAGQQLAISAAKSVWTRLLQAVGGDLNNLSPLVPKKIIHIASLEDDEIESKLRKPAGLSKSKLKSIIDLAHHFESGNLSDDILLGDRKKEADTTDLDTNIRQKLLKVKGIGPWSCDMFLIFHAQSPDILALGDLGVRKGTSLLFGVKGSGKKGSLCEKKDGDLLQKLHKPFTPYRSLSTYYMWKCVDSLPSNE